MPSFAKTLRSRLDRERKSRQQVTDAGLHKKQSDKSPQSHRGGHRVIEPNIAVLMPQ
jgi:hypothetical protein